MPRWSLCLSWIDSVRFGDMARLGIDYTPKNELSFCRCASANSGPFRLEHLSGEQARCQTAKAPEPTVDHLQTATWWRRETRLVWGNSPYPTTTGHAMMRYTVRAVRAPFLSPQAMPLEIQIRDEMNIERLRIRLREMTDERLFRQRDAAA